MIGRLFQVTMPPVVFNGADWIRVINASKAVEKEGEEDIYITCRVSKEGQFTGEESMKMDDFCDWLTGGVLIDPEAHTAAKILLQGNKI